jgi:hypothetical protein
LVELRGAQTEDNSGSFKSLATKRRNKSNPWFKRGAMFRSAVDVLRRSGGAMMVREIASATQKQFIGLQAAIHAALRKRDGGGRGWRGRARKVAVERGRQLRPALLVI